MKQHLRFFTLALLCAMCSVGWGQTEPKVYKFTFSKNDKTKIPHGDKVGELSKSDLPKTWSFPVTDTELGSIDWKFNAETEADPFSSTTNASYGWAIGGSDTKTIIKHVDAIQLKSLVNFINVKKVTVISHPYNLKNDNGKIFIKVGSKKSEIHTYTKKQEPFTFVCPEGTSGQVEINIEQTAEESKRSIIYFTSIEIEAEGTTELTNWMSYCSTSDLDFTSVADEFTPFIATSYKSDGNVGLTQINQVPAGMGILIKTNDDTGLPYAFDPASVTTTETIEQGEYTNLLQGVTSDQELATTGTMTFNGEDVPCTNFILAKKDGVVGFYKNKGGTLKANKAYLQLPTDLISGSNSISFYVEDGTTAIQNVSTRPATTDDAWYTLQGVRVAQPTRGLYIHNGKKVVVK